jgi:ABC-type branched-subunit amino acid transport system substrate-binding protein
VHASESYKSRTRSALIYRLPGFAAENGWICAAPDGRIILGEKGGGMAKRMGLVALLTLLSCSASVAGTPEDILIGVEAPSSLSPSGAAENLGMRLVMQAVNDQGGINGRKLAAKSYARSESGAAGDAQELANVARLDEQAARPRCRSRPSPWRTGCLICSPIPA